MKGIYGIINPDGAIYIGQSINIERRFCEYRQGKYKGQKGLLESMNRFSVGAHEFKILYILPSDCDKKILDNYEQFYMDQYRDAGISLLNKKAAGAGGAHTEETRRKISIAMSTIKRKPMSEEQKEHRRKLYTGRPIDENTKIKMKMAHKGRPGKPLSEITRKKLSVALKGRVSPRKGVKVDEQTKIKIGKANREIWNKKKLLLSIFPTTE